MNIALTIAVIFSLATTLMILLNYYNEIQKYNQLKKKFKNLERLNEKKIKSRKKL